MRLSALCWCLLALAGSAGCSPTKVATTGHPVPAAQSLATSGGKILTMRRMTTRDNQAAWGAVLLTGGIAAKPGSDSTQPLVEFIVQTDDGATLSIVQQNEAGFRPGDRVLIQHGDDTRIVPPG